MINPAINHNVFYLYGADRQIIGSFSNQQDYLISYADFTIRPGFRLGAGVVYQKNNIDTTGLNSQELSYNSMNQFRLPVSSASTAVEGRLTLGRLNFDGIVIDGVNLVSILDTTLQAYPHAEDNYTSSNNTLLFYKKIPYLRHSYLAFRGNVSITSSQVQSQHYYLGGLNTIRGFHDGEFSGQFAWYSNTELRIPSYVGDFFAIQNVIFSDSGFASNSFVSIFQSKIAVSIGTGMRILFPEINKVALRADFAYTVNPAHTYGLSLGLLQFF